MNYLVYLWKRLFFCFYLVFRVGIKYFLFLKYICKILKWVLKYNYIGLCLCDNRSFGNVLLYRKVLYLVFNKCEI